jgi:hypothetical protein
MVSMSLVRSFLNGFRRGSDGKIDWEAEARTCHAHGRRYDGCPLDVIDMARLERPHGRQHLPPHTGRHHAPREAN